MAGLGTKLRHLLDRLDGDIAKVYAGLGMPDYRPKFSPVVRALVAAGPASIRDLAATVGVTHSAASQTVNQMRRAGLVTLETGADARQRIAHLTERGRSLVPLIDAEWEATGAALAGLEAELPFSLDALLSALDNALARRPFHDRVTGAAAADLSSLLPPEERK